MLVKDKLQMTSVSRAMVKRFTPGYAIPPTQNTSAEMDDITAQIEAENESMLEECEMHRENVDDELCLML